MHFERRDLERTARGLRALAVRSVLERVVQELGDPRVSESLRDPPREGPCLGVADARAEFADAASELGSASRRHRHETWAPWVREVAHVRVVGPQVAGCTRLPEQIERHLSPADVLASADEDVLTRSVALGPEAERLDGGSLARHTRTGRHGRR